MEKEDGATPKKYTPEQVRKSIELAEAVARIEREVGRGNGRLEQYRNRGGSWEHYYDPRCEGAKTSLHRLRGELELDPLAEKLLPQAREIVPLAKTRDETLRETRFGELVEAIQHQLLVAHDAKGLEAARLFAGTHHEDDWRKFVEAFDAGDKISLLNSLVALLGFVWEDMLNVELPRAAPGYLNPDLPSGSIQRYTYLTDLPRNS
jgi:hypothetical protein